MVYIQETNNGQYVITIPKTIIRLTNWKKGTELIISEDHEGDIILKEVKPKKKKNNGKR